jgi:hypothetical protein
MSLSNILKTFALNQCNLYMVTPVVISVKMYADSYFDLHVQYCI